MKKIIIVFFLLSLLSCGKKEDLPKNEKQTQVSTDKKDTVTNPQSALDNSGVKNTAGLNDSLGLPSGSSIIVHTFDISEVSKLPDDIRYSGRIVAGVKWEDMLGANVLIITETEIKKSGDKLSKEIYGYHFIIDGNNNRLLWKIQDFIRDCEFDLTLNYIKNSLTLSDLNNDNIAESSFLYRLTCRSDVSPSDLKLIMHEGDNKYAIRGTMRVNTGGNVMYGGEMIPDKSFEKAPKEFLGFAKTHWKKFDVEKFR